MESTIWLAAIVLIAIPLFAWFYFKKLPKYLKHNKSGVMVFGKYSPLLTWFRWLPPLIIHAARFVLGLPSLLVRNLSNIRKFVIDRYILEFIVIILWGLFVGRNFLNLNSHVWSNGGEFGSAIDSNYIWQTFKQCGMCFLWNGNAQGGSPAFADMYGSMLHPVVIINTLFFGVVNGSKLTVVFSLILAGIAQWWIAKALGLGRLTRLWTACMAVAGGHITSRMAMGLVGVVLSTAACSMVIAPALMLIKTRKRQYTILLGLTLGMALLSGQGYMQVALLVCVVPGIVAAILFKKENIAEQFREFALAGLIGFLLAAPFLVPMAHFYPNIAKNADPNFAGGQLLSYLPLNNVIFSPDFYRTDILNKNPFPGMTGNYLGWIPIIFALLTVRLVSRKNFYIYAFFYTSIALVYLAASGTLFRVLVIILPFVSGVLNLQVIAGLVGPLILGLAGIGLQYALDFNWPRFQLNWNDTEKITVFPYKWIVLLAAVVYSLYSVNLFSQNWLQTFVSQQASYNIAANLRTEETQWVMMPFGHHEWMIPAYEAGLKVNDGIHPWFWKDREVPPPSMEVVIDDPENDTSGGVPNIATVIAHPENQYAVLTDGNSNYPCKATAHGGNIDVSCLDTPTGLLTIMERNFSGWQLWVDGQKTYLNNSTWLSVDLPAGRHTITLRYQPWDVWVGVALHLLGWAICIFFLRHTDPSPVDYHILPRFEQNGVELTA
jgi:hypothetical protein